MPAPSTRGCCKFLGAGANELRVSSKLRLERESYLVVGRVADAGPLWRTRGSNEQIALIVEFMCTDLLQHDSTNSCAAV